MEEKESPASTPGSLPESEEMDITESKEAKKDRLREEQRQKRNAVSLSAQCLVCTI